MSGGKISGIYVEIKGDSTQLKKDLSEARQYVTQQAKGISDALNNALSPAQAKNSINRMVSDLGTLSRASKLTGTEFKSLGVDLGELTRLTGLSESQFSALQSRMLQTSAEKAQAQALRSIQQSCGLTNAEMASLGQRMGMTREQIASVANESHGTSTALTMMGKAGEVALGLIGAQTVLEAAFRLKEFAKDVLEAGMNLESLTLSFTAIFESSEAAAEQMNKVRAIGKEYGQNFYVIADGYKQMTAAAKGTNLEGKVTEQLFRGITAAGTVLGMSNERVALTIKSFTDMISKGQIQMEEVKGQLGDNLPGAVKLFADALGIGTDELLNLAKEGRLFSDDVLPKVGDALDRAYVKAAQTAALETGRAAVNRLGQEWTDLKTNMYSTDIAVSGINAITLALQNMNSELNASPGSFRGIKNQMFDTMDQVNASLSSGLPMQGDGEYRGRVNKNSIESHSFLGSWREADAKASQVSVGQSQQIADTQKKITDEIKRGREELVKYIQTDRDRAKAAYNNAIKYAQTEDERNKALSTYNEALAAIDKRENAGGKKAANAAAAQASKFANAVRDVNKEFSEIEGNQASVWLANWEDRFSDLSEKIMKGTSGAERDAALARLKAADTATRQAIASGYQTMVEAKHDLEEFKSTLAAMGADDPHTAEIAKTSTLLSKLQKVGLISGQQAEEYRAKQQSVWAKEESDKNLETQRQFYSQYTQIAGDGFAVIEDGIMKQAEVFKKAGVDQVAVARWVEDQKLQYATDWESGAKRAWRNYSKSVQTYADLSENMVTDMAKGMEDALVEFTKTGEFSFNNMLSAMAEDLARFAASNLVQSLLGGSSSSGSSWSSSLIGMGVSAISSYFTGGASAAAGSASSGFNYAGEASSFFATHHSGGIAGLEPTSMRLLSASAFDGARRYHTGGIAGNEVPAVLKRGEGVFTEGQMKALGGGGSSDSETKALLREIKTAISSQKGSRIINAFDDATVANALNSSSGEKVILNHIRRNKDAVKAALQ